MRPTGRSSLSQLTEQEARMSAGNGHADGAGPAPPTVRRHGRRRGRCRPPPSGAPSRGRARRVHAAACPPRSRSTSAAPAGACCGTLAPQRLLVIASLVLATVSVGLSVLGPWMLGNATNLIFAGVIGKQLPAGVSKAQAVAQLRAEGQARRPTWCRRCTCTRPGHRLRPRRPGAAGGPAGLPRRLRRHAAAGPGDGDGRPARGVPAARAGRGQARPGCRSSYFDRQPRGEILSRVTNDIDNLAQTLQQTHEPAADLGADDRRRAHDDVRHLLAAGADRPGHRPGLGVRRGPDRQARPAAVHQAVVDHRQAERPRRGDVHRARAGERLRPAGRGRGAGSPSRTRSCTRPASGLSSSPAPSSRS